MTYYTILIERPTLPGESWGAYCPDLPGCVAAGDSEQDVLDRMARALQSHLEAMVEDGDDIPPPATTTLAIAVPMPVRPHEAGLPHEVA